MGISSGPMTYCHTRLHLGFPAMLKIWQVPACKMEPQRGIIIWRNSFPPAPAAARTRSTTLNASKIDSFSCLNSLKCVKHALNRFTISRVLVWTKIIFGDSIIMWFGWWYRLVWSQPKLNSKKIQCNNHYLWILKMGWLSKFISLRSIPF